MLFMKRPQDTIFVLAPNNAIPTPPDLALHRNAREDTSNPVFVLISTFIQMKFLNGKLLGADDDLAEDSMEREVGGDVRSNEVRSDTTSPHLYSLCGVSKKQNQGTNHEVSLIHFRCSNLIAK